MIHNCGWDASGWYNPSNFEETSFFLRSSTYTTTFQRNRRDLNASRHKLIANGDYLDALYSHETMEIATRKGRVRSAGNEECTTEERAN